MALRVLYSELENRGFDAGGGEILYYQNLPFTGTIVEFYEDGALLCEEEFDNGHVGGARRQYHHNGQVSEEYFITHNNYYGLRKEWDEEGNLTSEYDFGPKPIIRDYFEFNKTDFKINHSNFFIGLKHKGELFTGTLVMNYRQGNRKFIDFKDGNAHGRYTAYWDLGQLAVESIYEDGNPVAEKRWNRDGKIEQDWNITEGSYNNLNIEAQPHYAYDISLFKKLKRYAMKWKRFLNL